MAITVQNFGSNIKVPGFYAQTQFGAGPINIRTISLILLLCGLKHTSLGTILPDVDVVDCDSKETADSLAGVGSELARMAYSAIDEAKGFRLMIAAPAFAGGAVAASATLTFVGAATSAGTFRVFIAGLPVDIPVASADAIATQATTASAAINKAYAGRLPVTASPSSGVVTLTHNSKGIRGNDTVIYIDNTNKPATTVCTLAGGAAVTSSTNVLGVRMASGSGVETLTNILGVLYAGRYNRIAPAQADATSAGAWATQINAKAGATEGRTEHVVMASNGTLGAATSIAQTTLNNQRFQMLWCKDCETHPSEMAAAMASIRAATEQTQPNAGYDGVTFVTVKPQRFSGDWASFTTQQSALDNSVTPLATGQTGKVSVVRSIGTHSLNGSTPDYRTLDTGDATTPDYIRDALKIYWTTGYVVQNPFVSPDPGDGEPALEPGVASPKGWNREVTKILYDQQKLKILAQVAKNLPASEFNFDSICIMSVVSCVPQPVQHQLGVVVKQFNVSA